MSVRMQSEERDTWSILYSLYQYRSKNHFCIENVVARWFANWKFHNFAACVSGSVTDFVAVTMDLTVDFVVPGVCWSESVGVDDELVVVFVLFAVTGLNAAFLSHGTLAGDIEF